MSSKYFGTQAVVLSSRFQGEFDAQVALATPQWGLLQAKMPGVRRGRSRLKPLKEAGVWVDVNLYGKPGQSRPLTLLTGRIVKSFGGLRTNLEAFKLLFETLRFSEVFLVLFDSQSQEKFNLLVRTLEALESDSDSGLAQGLALSYKLKVLDLSGWRFSASDWARASLDDKMIQLCKNLEAGVTFAQEKAAVKKLEYFMELYTEGLAGQPV